MRCVLKHWRIWLGLVVMAALARDVLFAQQVLLFWPPPGFVMATSSGPVLEFVKPGENVEHWTELVTLQSLRRPETIRLADFYESLKAQRAARCPDTTEWTVIEQSEQSLLYEWRLRETCEGHPPQAEVARLVLTRDSFYRVAYATRGEFTPGTRATWLEWLRSQKVRK